jgi:MFS family permease
MSETRPAPAVPPLPWLIIIAGSLIALLSFGPRSAMGFFQLPMLADTGWDRTTFGLAMAIQNLFWGLGQPVFGAIADKYGTWKVLALSAFVYSAGLFIMSVAPSPGWFYIGGGVLVGLGVASASFGIVLAAFARNVEPGQRSMAFGIGTAAGSAGMFVFAPLSQGLIDAYGWQEALIWMAAMMFIIPFLAIPLRGNSNSGSQSKRCSTSSRSVKPCARRSVTRAICCWLRVSSSAVSRSPSSPPISRPICAISASTVPLRCCRWR